MRHSCRVRGSCHGKASADDVGTNVRDAMILGEA